MQQLADAGCAVLRFLHRQRDQIEPARIDVARSISRDGIATGYATQLDRIDPSLDRHTDADAVSIDDIGLALQTCQLDRMARKQKLACEQRSV